MFVETEDVKKHMKVLDVGAISKNLGEYYTSFAQEMKHNWHDMWEEQVHCTSLLSHSQTLQHPNP